MKNKDKSLKFNQILQNPIYLMNINIMIQFIYVLISPSCLGFGRGCLFQQLKSCLNHGVSDLLTAQMQRYQMVGPSDSLSLTLSSSPTAGTVR